jgi:mannitol-1-phosphate/altronate dehydrogenase
MEALDLMKNRIERIIVLLKKADETEWESYFKKVFSEIENAKNKDTANQIARDILGLFGGMASFNDLILSKNAKMLIKENDELKRLKNKIFKIASNMLASPSNWPEGKPANWEE